MQSAADEWCQRSSGGHCAMVIKATDGLESSTVGLVNAIESKHYLAGIVVETKHLDVVGNCLAMVDHLGVRSAPNAIRTRTPSRIRFKFSIVA